MGLSDLGRKTKYILPLASKTPLKNLLAIAVTMETTIIKSFWNVRESESGAVYLIYYF